MYKRHGHRVIVNKRGDMVVRPSMFELSMQQAMRGGTVAHHSTVSYQQSLVAVVTNQLSTSGRHADGLHGLLGLVKGVPQVLCFHVVDLWLPDVHVPFYLPNITSDSPPVCSFQK